MTCCWKCLCNHSPSCPEIYGAADLHHHREDNRDSLVNRAKSLTAEQLLWHLAWGGIDDAVLAAASAELQGGYKTTVAFGLKACAKAMKMYAKAQKLNLKNVLPGSSSRGGR